MSVNHGWCVLPPALPGWRYNEIYPRLGAKSPAWKASSGFPCFATNQRPGLMVMTDVGRISELSSWSKIFAITRERVSTVATELMMTH